MENLAMLEIRPVRDAHEKQIFLTFPWKVYQNDPLWVPPILSERRKVTDPACGGFFKNGYAEFFIAWQDGQPVGTICCAEDTAASQFKGRRECMIGFFECVEDYTVAAALLDQAQAWAQAHGLGALYGPYHLDYEDLRGLLIEGHDRPPAVLCGHTPAWYADFFTRYGMEKWIDDGLAYAFELDPQSPQIRRLARLADQVRARKPEIILRGANLKDVEGEIDRIHTLTNSALAHLPGFTPWPREIVAGVIRPMVDVIDPELVILAEIAGQPVGFLPGVPNLNEALIHANGLRFPWDYASLLWHMRRRPRCLAVKSVLVPPAYWDTGVGVLMFDTLTRRAIAKGYQWADLSITGEDNPDTFLLARHMGAKIYKRYRLYHKPLGPA